MSEEQQAKAPEEQPQQILAPPKRWVRWAAVLAALLGWWFSFNLVRLTAGAESLDPWLQASCGATEETVGRTDCLSVLNSEQAKVRLSPQEGALRLPVASFGMAYFAFVALWYAFVGPPTRDRRLWHLLIVLVVGAGVLSSLHFIHIMANVLHKWCSGCLAAHAANGALLLLTAAAWPWSQKGAPRLPHPSGRLGLATLCASSFALLLHLSLITLFVTGSNMQRVGKAYREIADDPAYVVWDYQRQEVKSIPPRAGEVLEGSPDAPHVVVAFQDMQCPACRIAHGVLKQVQEKFAGQVRIAYRYYPQDPECNPNPAYKIGGHASACSAAYAVEAARIVGGQDAFVQMRDLLFERQRELDARRFAEWAQEIGLDAEQFTEAWESEAVRQRVLDDIALGESVGVSAMPAIFLGGRQIKSWRRMAVWDALLVAESAESTPATQPAMQP